MRTYQETLNYIKTNELQYFVQDDPATTHLHLMMKLEVVAFAFGVALADVVNDFSNVQ